MTTHRCINLFAIGFLALGLTTLQASADVLDITPGKILRIDFAIPGNLPETPDLLMLNFGPTAAHPIPVVAIAPFGALVAHLYDEGVLLGTDSQSFFGGDVGDLVFNPANVWKSSTSIFGPVAIPPTIVNFGALFSGPTTGHIDFEILTGRIQIQSDSINLELAFGEQRNVFQDIQPSPVILSLSLVPEPSSSLLALCGGVAFVAGRIHSRRRRWPASL